MNKNYLYAGIIIVVAGLVFWMSQSGKNSFLGTSVSSSPSPMQSSVVSPTPSVIKATPKPTPGLIVKEVGGYEYWVNALNPINRRLTLNSSCTAVVPSQIAYSNNTQIMIDNTLSASPRVLKIGDKDYSLTAGGWLLVTLNSPKIPTQLIMFCGPMELGRITLQ